MIHEDPPFFISPSSENVLSLSVTKHLLNTYCVPDIVLMDVYTCLQVCVFMSMCMCIYRQGCVPTNISELGGMGQMYFYKYILF